jgi:hypothetical protein
MTTAVEVMTALTSHGAQVVVEGDRVRLLFSAGCTPPEALIEAARIHKRALRTILENRRQPRTSEPYGYSLTALQFRCPQLVERDRWQQAIRDAGGFLATWGAQAHALGWTARDLFGLHPVPDRPASNHKRLSRYDAMGLIWLLQGRAVVALTATEAAIQGATGVLVYRKQRKPTLGPLGDSLDDLATESPSAARRAPDAAQSEQM